MATSRTIAMVDGSPRGVTHDNACPHSLAQFADAQTAHGSAFLSVGWQAFDLLGIGMMLCTGSGQPIFENQTAQRILDNRDGLELSSNGALRTSTAPRQPLRNALRLAAEKSYSDDLIGHNSNFTVRRADGKWSLRVLVRSLEKLPASKGAPQVMVLMFDLHSRVRMTDEDLHQLYSFTSAESRLANLLCEGNTLRECCAQLCICDATARTHLKSLFKKTRTRRQYELVSLLLKSLGLARLNVQDL